MATNKNQHFVPRCYLRPFTLESANVAINLFNVDRRRFIEGAAVKHQCSSNYFYGKDLRLERALQLTEGAYSVALMAIQSPGYFMTDEHRVLLRRFWLLQHLRTEAASRRAVEMAAESRKVIGATGKEFNLGIRDAVLIAMRSFVESIDSVDDLKVCLFRNRTGVPFVTSDDPAVLTNRWHLVDKRTESRSFGLHSAGSIFLLPLSPEILCVGYDGEVYGVPHERGWVSVRHAADIEALNQHQYLNCRANIFVRDSAHSELVRRGYDAVASVRPESRFRTVYAVRDTDEGGFARFRAADPVVEAHRREEAIIHTESIHACPTSWPRQIQWRHKGYVYSNGSGVGYLRRARIPADALSPFQRELARPR
jgi:hypothetical protein